MLKIRLKFSFRGKEKKGKGRMDGSRSFFISPSSLLLLPPSSLPQVYAVFTKEGPLVDRCRCMQARVSAAELITDGEEAK